MRTAPCSHDEGRTFRITHPFHPLSGREFALVTHRRTWGKDRVCYQDDTGRFCSVPAAWTSVSALEPFVAVAAGRAAFRLEDLRELCRLVDMLMGREAMGVGEKEEERV